MQRFDSSGSKLCSGSCPQSSFEGSVVQCCDVLSLHSVGLLNQYCQMCSNAWLKISDFSVGSPLFYLTLSVTCVTHRLLFLFWKTELGLDRRFGAWVERVCVCVCARVNSIFLEVSCDWVYLILAQLLSFNWKNSLRRKRVWIYWTFYFLCQGHRVTSCLCSRKVLFLLQPWDRASAFLNLFFPSLAHVDVRKTISLVEAVQIR